MKNFSDENKKQLLVLPSVIMFLLVFALVFTAIILVIVLFSVGILSVPVSALGIAGLLKNIASDLAPAAMLMAGIFCIFLAVFIICILVLSVPPAIRLSYRVYLYLRIDVSGSKAAPIKLTSKNKKSVIFFSVISFLLSVLSAIFIYVFQMNAHQNGFTSTVYRESFTLPAALYLDLSVTDIPLKVSLYDGDEILINYQSQTPLVIEESSYRCSVYQDPDFAFSLFAKGMLSYSMEVFIPNIIYNDVKITTASGMLEIDDIATENMFISSKSGGIKLFAGQQENIEIIAVKADIICNFNEFNAETKIDAKKGNVLIRMPEDSSLNLQFSTENGSFYSDLFPDEYRNFKESINLRKGDNPKNLFILTNASLKLFRSK